MLMLILIGHVEIEVLATVAQAECQAVDSAKIDIVGIETVMVLRAFGEGVQIGVLFEW